jgi:hypothetical protein
MGMSRVLNQIRGRTCSAFDKIVSTSVGLWIPGPVIVRVYIYEGTTEIRVCLLFRAWNDVGYLCVPAGVMGIISIAHVGGTRRVLIGSTGWVEY